MEIEDASGSQPPGVELEWGWLVGGEGGDGMGDGFDGPWPEILMMLPILTACW